ncbi:DUF1835 domain-containing protein [Paenisporosarcina sp. HGH0030]|uniref:DUF1835 domain-containing protein n=1 Tax=Paenisporosarcina sp. HGH0030 TaxID=1078085 RepID=UPI0011CB53FD|nr:DUF1835 domain-containing protein [Paenisporosarcina sp. HGH0030]
MRKIEELQRTLMTDGNKKIDKIQAQTVHIIFGESPAGSLRAAFRNTPYEKTEEIIVLPDILSVGPVKNIHTKEGMQARFHWFKERYRDEGNERDVAMLRMIDSVDRIKAIPQVQDIVIWTCNNAHEQTGLRIVLALLKGKLNTIFVINTYTAFHKLYDLHPYEEDYPKATGELPSEKLSCFYEQYKQHPLKDIRRTSLCEEGKNLLNNDQSLLRTWADHQLWHYNVLTRDDDLIITCAKRLNEELEYPGFIKAARVIGEVLGQMEQYTGDEWLEYRLRCLIELEIFEYEGNLKAMRYYGVKLKEEFSA